MADSSTSSLTSTSHTLTIATPYGIMAPGSGSLPSLGDIASALAFRDSTRRKPREAFLTPNASLSTASSEITQVALGTFAGQISDEQQERLRKMHAATAARKKRKRTNNKAGAAAAASAADDNDDDTFVRPVGPLLKIRRVHVTGFEIPQIWQQSNRILATSTQQSQSILDQLEKEDESEEEEEDDEDDDEALPSTNGVHAGSDSEEEDDEDEEGLLEDDLAALEAEEDEDDDDLSMGEDGEDDFGEDEEEEDEEDEDDEDTGHGPAKDLVEDADGLNDGFFDLKEFNKQSQWFEAQDARADPNTDAASEDEELDWHGDPFAAPMGGKKSDKKAKKQDKSSSKSKSKKGRDSLYSDDEEDNASGGDDDDEEDGPPIFGNMDLDAPSGESDIEDMEDTTNGGLANGFDDMDLTANDIFYKDFFAPPAKKRGDRDRPGRKPAQTNGDSSTPFQPDEADVQRAIKDVRRDLFEQLSDASGDEDSDGIDALSDASAGDVRSRRSAHERRQAKILAEIRRLENEAVKQKNWTVSGEASASARPVNSLLEEDLDFEHIGKPVPVITQEITEDIEALVKRRILEQSFDEVRRRYGTGFGENEDGTRRGLIEIDDSQAKKGLAAVYEEEHQQTTNPDTYVSQSDERVQAEEREVERMWLDVSAKLDALSNWHYKPRPAAPQMSVVADVATVTMEDAQPATAQGVSGGASMLAPQEVYKPGADKKDKDKNIVVVARSGLPVARDEMTREDKLRRRRRNKERIRKSGSGLAANGNGNAVAGGAPSSTAAGGAPANASQADTIATLKRAGVKVIGRKGELQDVEGNKPQVSRALSSGNFKL